MTRIIYTCGAMAIGSAVLWAAGSGGGAAQQQSQRRAAAAAPAPTPGPWPMKLKDGQPDVRGIWQAAGAEGGSGTNMEPMANMMGGASTSPGIVIDPPDGRIPYLPWARVRRDEVQKSHLSPNRAQVDTRNRGWPDGVPRINYYSVNAFQIAQTTGAVLILYEAQHEFRYIPLDSRPQIDNGVKLWMGSSRGRWEGTTLIVDVTNISDQVRFSVSGDFASDKVTITERWKFLNADTIAHSATFTDPQVYTQPFTVAKTLRRVKDKAFEIMEYSGVEGDKDQYLMVDIPANMPGKK